MLILEIQISEDIFVLGNLYAPNQVAGVSQPLQMSFLNQLTQNLDRYKDHSLILGGDFNTYLNPDLDKQPSQSQDRSQFAEAILSLCEDLELVDCWRILNPNAKRFTWRRTNPIQQSRLDYWLISSPLLNSIAEVDISPSFRSDHSMLKLSLQTNSATKRGPGLWKFNSMLLKDSDYVNLLKTKIEEFGQKYLNQVDKSLKWELIKYDIRGVTIDYCKRKAKERREAKVALADLVTSLEHKLCRDTSVDIAQQYQNAKHDLENIITQESQSAAFLARVDYLEFNEKNSSFFAKQAQKTFAKKSIANLVTEDGQPLSGAREISTELVNFYERLYASKGIDQDLQKSFLKAGVNTLTEDDKEICEKAITVEELEVALRLLPNGKTPGSDGLSTDFYKFWWPYIGDFIFDSFTYAVRLGHLSIDQRRGVISLLPKKGKDIRFLKNWRPISLLNTDYKILTKLLAGRMQRVIANIIHPDQVGYIKRRYIGQNIRTIIDMIEYTKTTHTPGLIAFLDFEKAFDSLEWSFLEKALCTMGFGEHFVNWVHTVYSDINSCILNNGFTTKYFNLQRGIRQGCPLSAYLFIIAVEFLATSIRKDAEIKGIKIANQEIKVIQMADDTTVFLQDAKDLKRLLHKLHLFAQASGLKLNKIKTEAMWIGSNEGSHLTPCGVNWVSEVYSLGTWFSTAAKDANNRNFSEKFDKFTRALNMWKPLDLSLKGKITVIKNMAMPTLLYATSNLVVPDEFISKVTGEIYAFLWNNGPDKIKRNTMIADIKYGGLKMIDMKSMIKAQKVMWAKRLLSSDEGSWKLFPILCFGHIGTSLLSFQYDPQNIPLQLPPFYEQVLKAWGEAKQAKESIVSAFDVRRQFLMFNKNILIDGQYVGRNKQFLKWAGEGIILIHNIVDTKGNFLSFQALQNEYNVRGNILMYNSLKDAIPSEWRSLLKQMTVAQEAVSAQEGPCLETETTAKPLCLLTNKDVYSILISKIALSKPTCVDTWISEIALPQYFKWESVFKLSFETTRSTKLQSLQFRILHRIYPCNLWLSKWEPNTLSTCSKCDDVDSIHHYFYCCNPVKSLWKSLENWWRNCMHEEVNLNELEVIFGFFGETLYCKALNLCILITKQFISNCRYIGMNPSLYVLLLKIKTYLQLEKYICIRNDRLQSFDGLDELYEALG